MPNLGMTLGPVARLLEDEGKGRSYACDTKGKDTKAPDVRLS